MRHVLSNASIPAMRDGIQNAISIRVSAAMAKGGGTPALDSAIKIMRNASDYTLASAVALSFDCGAFMISHERDGAMCNAYAIQKLPLVLNMLAGGLLAGGRGNPGTIRATLECLRDGSATQKDCAFAINDYMNRDVPGGSYASGATQSSSALRVLEALGVVSVTGRNGGGSIWGVTDPDMFQHLLQNARGVLVGAFVAATPATPTGDDTTPLTTIVSAPTGDIIEGECLDVTESEIAALPMLDAPPAMLALSAPLTPAQKRAATMAAKKASASE